jgi:hypothetical protein
MRRPPRAASLGLALLLVAAPVTAAGSEGSVTATVRISGVTVSLNLSAATIAVGQSVKAEVLVTNVGDRVIRTVVVELRLDEAGLGVRGGPSKGISQLRAGTGSSVSWAVCGRTPGAYIVLATATVDSISIDSEARLLTVTESTRRPC